MDASALLTIRIWNRSHDCWLAKGLPATTPCAACAELTVTWSHGGGLPMPSRRAKSRTIQVNYLTRAEGEAALRIRMRDGELLDLHLEIFEPPRFFESFLRGRDSREAPDLT